MQSIVAGERIQLLFWSVVLSEERPPHVPGLGRVPGAAGSSLALRGSLPQT
jgi:hypothetical protein